MWPKKNHEAFYISRRLRRIIMAANTHMAVHININISSRGQQWPRCDLGQSIVDGSFNANDDRSLSVSAASPLKSEEMLISRHLLSALMWGQMKGRTESLVSSPTAAEMLYEQGCGNAKASSKKLSRAPKASLAGCRQRGLWEITRD